MEKVTLMVDRLSVAGILEPLYRAEEDFGALVPVLEAQQAGAYGDPIARVETLREIARLEKTYLKDIIGQVIEEYIHRYEQKKPR